MKNKIIILAGDPNSINSEIIFKSWKKINSSLKKKILIFGNFNLLKKQSSELNVRVPLNCLKSVEQKNCKNYLNILDFPLEFKNCFKVPKSAASKYVKTCLNFAHVLSQKKKIPGFINCPIDKKLIKQKGIFGVTELIARKSNKINSEVMVLYNKRLSVVPITTHIKIKEISKKLNSKLIIKKTETVFKHYYKIFRRKPKIAILGLNPHNDELDKNSEEKKIIIPAIRQLKKKIKLDGPLPADSFFIEEYKKYNLIIGMYHDQVLIPFKNLFKFNAINITLGLDYIRMSPDHGTAINLIKKNKANIESLFNCINLMNKCK